MDRIGDGDRAEVLEKVRTYDLREIGDAKETVLESQRRAVDLFVQNSDGL